MNLRSLKIVGLKKTAHTIQVGVFPSVRDIRTNPYHTIIINMYGFVFKDEPIPYDFCECI